MSALSVSNANVARQSLYNMSAELGGSKTRSSAVFYIMKALFLHLAANKGNPDLELKYQTSGANASIVGGACTMYAIFLKKGVVATDSYFKLSNHATQVQAASEVIVKSSVAGEEFCAVWPNGYALDTGCTSGSYTAYDGANATTASTATHNFYGYVLVGA